MISRRQWGSVCAASAVTVALSQSRTKAAESIKLTEGAVILFQGDSITDARRDRKAQGPNDPNALGHGYPMLLAAGLLADYASLNLNVYNRGISGNKVPDLASRWTTDTIELKPSVLSILIGVNDMWHKLNGKYDGTVETYAEGYRTLLQDTQKVLPETRIVLCEPFVLRCGAVNESWFPDFDKRREVAGKLAQEFGLTYVAFQRMFDEAIGSRPAQYWAADGVHPTLAGHALMAKEWRSAVGV